MSGFNESGPRLRRYFYVEQTTYLGRRASVLHILAHVVMHQSCPARTKRVMQRKPCDQPVHIRLKRAVLIKRSSKKLIIKIFHAAYLLIRLSLSVLIA
jgi:hypothetical protein